jgi:hypothetical protein
MAPLDLKSLFSAARSVPETVSRWCHRPLTLIVSFVRESRCGTEQHRYRCYGNDPSIAVYLLVPHMSGVPFLNQLTARARRLDFGGGVFVEKSFLFRKPIRTPTVIRTDYELVCAVHGRWARMPQLNPG